MVCKDFNCGWLLFILLSNQTLSETFLNLICCVSIRNKSHLLLHGETECWQFWQVWIIIYVGLFIIPQWMTFLVGPGLLKQKVINIWQFLTAVVFPSPFLIYWAIKVCYKRKTHPTEERTKMYQQNLTEEILDKTCGAFDTSRLPQ